MLFVRKEKSIYNRWIYKDIDGPRCSFVGIPEAIELNMKSEGE